MALVTIRRSPSVQTPRKTNEEERSSETEEDAGSRVSRSLNECYFANKGAALVLGGGEAGPGGCERRRSPARAQPQPDIQHHLQAMFYLLRAEETLKMAVKLESAHPGRTRYLVVVCRGDEAALLGIDCNERTSVGLVLRVLADTSINLDGDGGFSVRVCNQQHIFKPVSVQAMWSALQTLHRAGDRARQLNHFAGGASHAWAAYYEARVDSDRSCLNEWHAMDCLESRRPPSPDSLRLKPRQRDETERIIRSTLKEIMMSVDLDEVTSKVIRGRLENDLDMDLAEYKSFIDQEMLTILGQMDAPTEIFDHVYLGSEWNASNLEELQRNGVRHILNVTREIDNFFPGMFDYLNVRVYDDDKTDLLKHWDNTFKYINKARNEGSKVLVHCKMGISRSASVVIAYAMKAYNWNFGRALRHVRTKRGCIKPNGNFLGQLETYQGILDAMKNKEKLQRSKSETNLESRPRGGAARAARQTARPAAARRAPGAPPAPAPRPRSWSPDSSLAAPAAAPPTSVSLENLALACETRHMLMPCAGGSYSVSPNQIIRLKEEGAPSVRHIVHEIENAAADRRAFSRRLHRRLAHRDRAAAAAAATAAAAAAAAADPHAWDPGERAYSRPEDSDDVVTCDSGTIDSKATIVDAFCNLMSDDTKRSDEEAPPPSRPSSCGSVAGAPAPEPEPARPAAAGRRAPAPADISDNERKFNETCAILKELAAAAARMAGARAGGASTWGGRLAASAPADPARRPRARRRRLLAASHPDLSAAAAAAAGPRGLVSNLKKEFEALSGAPAAAAAAEPGGADESPRRAGKSRSLPSDRPAPAAAAAPAPAAEDVSVRVLVDRYDKPSKAEAAGEPGRGRAAPELGSKKSRLSSEGEGPGRARGPAFLRNSFCGALRGAAPAGPAERPPVAPNVVSMSYPAAAAPTVMSKAQNKKQLQHGKTHPLTRLNMNRSNNRCSNPVYNTM